MFFYITLTSILLLLKGKLQWPSRSLRNEEKCIAEWSKKAEPMKWKRLHLPVHFEFGRTEEAN
jgi:hypothetical protein